jgi:hypothetical protein
LLVVAVVLSGARRFKRVVESAGRAVLDENIRFETTLVRNLYFPDQLQTASTSPVESTSCERRGMGPFGLSAKVAA